MDKEETKKKSASISVSEARKLVSSENNSKCGFLDVEGNQL